MTIEVFNDSDQPIKEGTVCEITGDVKTLEDGTTLPIVRPVQVPHSICFPEDLPAAARPRLA